MRPARGEGGGWALGLQRLLPLALLLLQLLGLVLLGPPLLQRQRQPLPLAPLPPLQLLQALPLQLLAARQPLASHCQGRSRSRRQPRHSLSH